MKLADLIDRRVGAHLPEYRFAVGDWVIFQRDHFIVDKVARWKKGIVYMIRESSRIVWVYEDKLKPDDLRREWTNYR